MRGFHQGQKHDVASSQGRIYGRNILYVTNELFLASRGEPYMSGLVARGLSGSHRSPKEVADEADRVATGDATDEV